MNHWSALHNRSTQGLWSLWLFVALCALCVGQASAQSNDSIPEEYVYTPDPLEAQFDSIFSAPLDTTGVLDSLKLPTVKVKQKRDKTNFLPDPTRATWLALVFPGAGQIYNRKFWKLPVFYGGFLGCMYALTWNNQMLRDYTQAYLDIMDDDPNTASYMAMLPMNYDMTGKEGRFKTIFKNKKNRYRKYRDMSIFAFFGVYALSVIDAYVDAELSTFDISRNLSLNLEPAVIELTPYDKYKQPKAFGLQCNLNF